MLELLQAAGPVIEKLGIIGVLLLVIAWQNRRHDKIAEAAEKQLHTVNEKRVAEAQQASKDTERHLELMTQMMQHVATSATAFQMAAQTIDIVSRRLERIVDQSERNTRS